jgi:hypothetical protein
MKILKNASETLARADEALEAGRDQFTTQSVLNVALAVGVVVALIIAASVLVRAGD